MCSKINFLLRVLLLHLYIKSEKSYKIVFVATPFVLLIEYPQW
jgi:hypothetical protein